MTIKGLKRRIDKSAKKLRKRLMSDREFSSRQYESVFGVRPNLESPRTFNEKLQWKKIYDRDPLYTRTADKWLAREYVAARVGTSLLIPLVMTVESVAEIEWRALPSRFVMKASHGCGWNIIVHDKSRLDKDSASARMKKWLSTNYYWAGREWAYKHIVPRIVVEEMLVDKDGNIPVDYKFFCFHGKVHIWQVDFDRFTEHKRNLYDPEGNVLPVSLLFPNDPDRHLDVKFVISRMIPIAERLAQGIDFVRVDLYRLDEKVYFGELTHYPGNGKAPFTPQAYDEELGGRWTLRTPRERNRELIRIRDAVGG